MQKGISEFSTLRKCISAYIRPTLLILSESTLLSLLGCNRNFHLTAYLQISYASLTL